MLSQYGCSVASLPAGRLLPSPSKSRQHSSLEILSLPRIPGAPYLARFSRDVGYHFAPPASFPPHWQRTLRFAFPHLAKNERDTPISCTRLYSMAACAAFIKESRMKLVEPTGLNRKSGVWGTHWSLAGRNPKNSAHEFLFLISHPPALPTHREMKRVCFLSESRMTFNPLPSSTGNPGEHSGGICSSTFSSPRFARVVPWNPGL
jgi:hypothetical protein